MPGPLTPRQEQVMRLLIDGKRDKEIALLLSIGVGTVQTHVCNVCHTLGASTRVQAAVIISTDKMMSVMVTRQSRRQ